MNQYVKFIIGLAVGSLLLNACYEDLGNYNYHPINDVVIADTGFVDTTYLKTSFVDTLRITPVITASLESDFSKYEYEWVARGGSPVKGYSQFDLGNTLALNYLVELPTDSYTIYFRMKDRATGIIYTKTTSLTVSDIFSIGWLVLGEDNEGYAQLDMVATPYTGDTVVLKNITLDKGLPKLKNPKYIYQVCYPRKDKIHLATGDGAYWLDPADYSSGTDCFYSSLFFDPTVTDRYVLEDIVQLAGSYRCAIVDGKTFSVTSFIESENFGSASNHYKGNYNEFKVGNKIGVNYKERSGSFVFYNMDEKRFVYMSSIQSYCDSLKDTPTDKTIFTWKTGLDYVTTVNSCYTTSGLTYTLLKDGSGNHSLYAYRISAYYGIIKNAKYELTGATHITNAKFFGHSNTNTFLFYTVGSQLYGYDYVRKVEYMLKDFGEEITLYKHEIHNTLGMSVSTDNFYIGTCDPALPKSASGKLYGFKVLSDVNRISIEPLPGTPWIGLCKIAAISYRDR